MPVRAAALWTQLGAPGDVHAVRFADLPALDGAGWRVAKGEALFPKAERAAAG